MKPARAVLPLLLAAAAAGAAVPKGVPAGGELSVRDGRFAADGRPVALVCADGVPLPADDAAADALAERLAADGFNAVRLPDAASPGDVARFGALEAACHFRGIRLWADALVPALAVPPSAADVSVIDDPFTADAWTNALAEAAAAGFDPFLAAPWDPRLESLLQRRIRDWARAFNPRTGCRRNDLAVWSLVGFSSGWRNAFLFSPAATNAPAPPAFFRDGFLAEWNVWLYDRYGTDEKAAAILLPGESVVSNAVAWIGSPFGAPPDEAVPAERIREEKLFLHHLYQPHASRLVRYFRETGGRAATVPVFARWGEGTVLLKPLSDVRFFDSPDEGFPTIAFVDRDPSFWELSALAERLPADLIVFPAATARPPRSDDWLPFDTRYLRACATDADGRLRMEPGMDRPDAALRHFGFHTCSPFAETNTFRFAATGAALRIERLEPDADPDAVAPEPPEGSGLSVVVWFPPPDEERAAAAAAAEEAGRADVDVTFVFEPDTPGAPMNLAVRVAERETGKPVPFGLAVAGPALRKRAWRDFSPGADTAAQPLPKDRVLRLDAAPGPRQILFPPEEVASDILDRLEGGF